MSPSVQSKLAKQLPKHTNYPSSTKSNLKSLPSPAIQFDSFLVGSVLLSWLSFSYELCVLAIPFGVNSCSGPTAVTGRILEFRFALDLKVIKVFTFMGFRGRLPFDKMFF